MNTSPMIALRFSQDVMQDKRVMFGGRVSPVVLAMIKAESATRDVSEGQLVDDLVLSHCRSPEAMRILTEYARSHPLVVAFHEVTALRETAKEPNATTHQKPADKPNLRKRRGKAA